MHELHLDEHQIDLRSGVITGPGGEQRLSERERESLRLLANAEGAVLSRAALGGPAGSRAADITIGRLRRRLGASGRYIVTVRGMGYRLDLPSPSSGLDLGWGRLELDRARVVLVDGSVTLSPLQVALLTLLAERLGRAVPRAELAQAIWGHDARPRALDVLVHRLRERLEVDPAQPRFLISRRGKGLVLLDTGGATQSSAAARER